LVELYAGLDPFARRGGWVGWVGEGEEEAGLVVALGVGCVKGCAGREEFGEWRGGV